MVSWRSASQASAGHPCHPPLHRTHLQQRGRGQRGVVSLGAQGAGLGGHALRHLQPALVVGIEEPGRKSGRVGSRHRRVNAGGGALPGEPAADGGPQQRRRVGRGGVGRQAERGVDVGGGGARGGAGGVERGVAGGEARPWRQPGGQGCRCGRGAGQGRAAGNQLQARRTAHLPEAANPCQPQLSARAGCRTRLGQQVHAGGRRPVFEAHGGALGQLCGIRGDGGVQPSNLLPADSVVVLRRGGG